MAARRRRLANLATGCAAPKWFPDGKRIAFISWVWPDLATDALQAKRRKERKDAKVKAHVTERAEFRFWDHWLTDGREPHVFVCDVATGRCRDALARTGLALPPWEPSRRRLRHRARRPRDRDHRRSRARAADDEPDRHRHRRSGVAPEARADRGARTRPTRIRAIRRTVARSCSIRTTRSARSTTRAISCCCSRSGGAMRRLAPEARSRRLATSRGRPTAVRSCSRSRTAAASASRASPLDARRCPRWSCRGGTVGGFAQSRDGSVLAFDRAIVARIRRRCSRAAPTAAASARSRAVNRALLARHALGEVREVTVKGWGGEPVQMWITYPPNFDPQQKWPLLHSIHGGPHAAHHRRLAFPLEHAGVRGPRLRRRRSQLPRLVRVRPEMARDDHRPLRDEGVRRRRGRDRLAAAPGLHRPLAAGGHRRQLRRLHGRLHERPHRSLPHVSSAMPAATTGSA